MGLDKKRIPHHVFAYARSPSPEDLSILWPVWFSANCLLVVYVQCINTDLLYPISAKVGLVNALAYSAFLKKILLFWILSGIGFLIVLNLMEFVRNILTFAIH